MTEKMTMSVREMAQQLGISAPKAYDLAKSDGFPAIFIGKRIVVPVKAFEKWLEDQTAAPHTIA